ncbi:MAG TPA: SDR family oxidoreductase [Thermoanaerobaculia bacterium]|jgi:NAD(P)-dependent dehydrogenase (short-subunit alcohol dehydrogenase family)|nr:SDR family oxidoreductase [Thermoanaerobaculia bacterium]
MPVNMQGKICLVTGATSGIGRATALGLARQGAHVVIAGRDAARTQDTLDSIRKETGNPQVESLLADFSSQAEVRRLAAEFRARHGRLDVLVNNAGAVFMERGVTVDGFERTWAVNHLAGFLLTLELKDLIEASAPTRIVNVSSALHAGRTLDLDKIQEEKIYGIQGYGQSKLANVLFTYALARRLAGTGVTANCLHPGVVSTKLMKPKGSSITKVLMTLIQPFLRSPEKGAATSIYVASSPEIAGVTGKYFVDCKAVPSSPVSYDEALQERLWELSLRQTGRKD